MGTEAARAWKRYWIPRPASAALDEAGFLVDPELVWGAVLSPDAISLPSLDWCSVLVLLGEPGMGKSTEIAADVQRLRARSGAAETVLHVDLRDFESLTELRAVIFGGAEITAWRQGTQQLALFFDSLDEGLAATPMLADGLARELATLAADQTLRARLRIRIACRTAVWPDSAEIKLRAGWGDDHLRSCVLAPLRRGDVVALLRETGIADPQAALVDLLLRGAGALAARPVTLNFLAAAVREGAVLDTQVALYAQGCLRLARISHQHREFVH